jgi:hypothetical protein
MSELDALPRWEKRDFGHRAAVLFLDFAACLKSAKKWLIDEDVF